MPLDRDALRLGSRSPTVSPWTTVVSSGANERWGRRSRHRRLRVERGLSQRDLAEPGVTYAYISRIEAGQRTPSMNALVKLAFGLGTTALFLATGTADAVCPVCGRAAA
jgi:DNA-binding XRE family transcriptional regulator